ncbi:MAG: DNA recombination protein RmuC [Planctomycetes bacterium]|nr:DNA recombination protein RmuC [Planctomycetota bacterium]NOG55801.1 DNA recombination protein RmuC [Planctomycetota bacterium]
MLPTTLAIVFGILLAMTAAVCIWLWADRAHRRDEADEHKAEVESILAQRRELEQRLEEAGTVLTQARDRVARLETEVEQMAIQHKGRLEAYEEARRQMEQTFKALAGATLEKSGEELIKRTKELIDARQKESDKDFELKRKSIEDMVKPVRESLTNYDKRLTGIEESRVKAHAALQKELELVQKAGSELTLQTAKLERALRAPHGRGAWGEMQLRRIVELAGMTAYCDFTEQVSVQSHSDESVRRPDMVFTLPNNRQIVVDSKAPIDAYQDAAQAVTDAERETALKRHAAQVREQVKKLSHKSYWAQFEQAPDFVVMFVPGDAFLSEALRVDTDLLDYALQHRVVPTSPATLLALLKAVAYGWQQERLADDARLVIEQGRILHERICVLLDYLADTGKHIGRAVTSYNKMVSSLERRFIPAAQRLESMEVRSTKSLPAARTVDVIPQEPSGVEPVSSPAPPETEHPHSP